MELHVCGVVPLHWMDPGAQLPVQAPFTQASFTHATAALQVPAWHVCTPLSEHCVAPWVHASVQTPSEQVPPPHDIGALHSAFGPHTCTLLPEHSVLPGTHVPAASAFGDGGDDPESTPPLPSTVPPPASTSVPVDGVLASAGPAFAPKRPEGTWDPLHPVNHAAAKRTARAEPSTGAAGERPAIGRWYVRLLAYLPKSSTRSPFRRTRSASWTTSGPFAPKACT